MSEALKRAEAAGARSPLADKGKEEALEVAKETMRKADMAVKAREGLRQAIQARDYDKIQVALDKAKALELNVPEARTCPGPLPLRRVGFARTAPQLCCLAVICNRD